MSKKFIQEYQNNNFVYPNNDPWEYGVDIIHDINNNSVSGEISGFAASLYGGNIVFSFTYIWNLNGATPFIQQSGNISVLSVHMMDANNLYYKPWRLVGFVNDANPNITTKTDTVVYTVTPAMMGVSGFTSGTYYFEVRMIGEKQIFPICVEANIITPTLTPTPTVTPTKGYIAPTPTPTITPTKSPLPSTPCYCYEIVVTGTTGGEGGGIANLVYNDCFGVQTGRIFSVGPGTYYQCIQTVGGVVQYDPVLTTGIDQSYLTIPGVGNCNTGYACTGYTPAPVTPTPTPTNGYVAPTPTPTSSSVPVTTPTVTPTSSSVLAATPTPTPTVTPTSGTTTYDYYLADQYECLTPSGCSFSTSNVPVAFPSGYSYIGTHYYQPIAPNGYVYKITSSSTYAVSIILDTSLHSSNCSIACGVS